MTKAAAKALEEFEANFAKSFGDDTARWATKVVPYKVISTGSVLLDVALGVGGYVEGRLHEVWSAPDLGKTTLALMGAAEAQRKYPTRRVAYIDVENKLDKAWAVAHGVDLARLWIYVPKTAEDVADALKRCLDQEFFCFAVIDSIGAMISKIEQEKDAEEATVAAVPRIVTRMVKIATVHAERHGAVVLFVNQLRCLEARTPILTQRGILPVSDVAVGDIVMGDGRPVSVLAKVGPDRVEGVRLHLRYRPSLTISENHLQTVVGEDGQLTERLAKDLVRGDWVVCPKMVPSVTAGVSLPDRVAAMLGLHFADGSIYNGHISGKRPYPIYRVSVTERDTDRKMIAWQVMQGFVGDRGAVRPLGEYGIYCASRLVVQELVDLGVGGTKSDKLLPDVVKRGSDETITTFLRFASFDTHFSTGGASGLVWTGETKGHLEDIALLLWRLGIGADLRYRKDTDRWHLYLSRDDAMRFGDVVGFAEPKKNRLIQEVAPGFGARGKYDVVPPQIVEAVFGHARKIGLPGISSFPHYGALSMVVHKSLNGSRERVLEFSRRAERFDPYFKGWSDYLDGNRFTSIRNIESGLRFEAFDLEVEGGRFVAGTVLTHNSNINKYGGPTTLPGGWALKYGTTIKLKLRYTDKKPLTDKVRGDTIEVAREIAIEIERNKCAAKGQTVAVLLASSPSQYGPIGIDKADECASVGIKLGVIPQAGSWVTLPTTGERFQGRDKVVVYLREHPEEIEEIRKRCLDLRSEDVVEAVVDDEVEMELVTSTTPANGKRDFKRGAP